MLGELLAFINISLRFNSVEPKLAEIRNSIKQHRLRSEQNCKSTSSPLNSCLSPAATQPQKKLSSSSHSRQQRLFDEIARMNQKLTKFTENQTHFQAKSSPKKSKPPSMVVEEKFTKPRLSKLLVMLLM